MGFTVYDSPNSWTHDGSTATREYVISWDQAEGSNTNTYLAKVALDTYLSGFAETVATTAIRDLNEEEADPFDPETERLLSFYLHGLPIQPFAVTEVAETEGKHYTATVTWGDSSDPSVNNVASAGASSRATGGDADTEVTFTTRLSASAIGRTIDYAPIEHLFVSDTSTLVEIDEDLSPGTNQIWYPNSRLEIPFPLGTLNVERPSADGELTVNGLSYSSPSVDLTLTYNIKGQVLASWVEEVALATKRGVLNTDEMVINNITYPAYTLLLCQFDAEYQNDGNTTVTIGFSQGYLTNIVFTSVADGWMVTGGGGATRYTTSNLDYFGSPFSLVSETAPPLVESVRVLGVTSHDYVWSFYNNYLEGVNKIGTRDYLCMHRVWGEAVFGAGTEGSPGLFGSNTL